ncbi:efflux RND transporter periplasmic adaptor subunit [Rhodoplanes sp. TEM]|uniref:Efflux RND transporter periplasmic adaptor subunit n=1 Tax=Rhodoplanes tepidamans TaxID=200616 RepID=A0ABT5JF66_RHOTP|nr:MULTISPECIES: efflux RND transporter periplasmic adaptor subunit [Rhodoplanes]MDC7788262.1 efflux RND transporter periplasmic adaptor subunit [Rhodoplanes tepidamans]MDC7982933.1 efflux RND transporter periplasmic adaptor subunit [Rhodoplanes sp. TEM]MDQ0355869.1 multidrug efflux pump subunit AcrA (membrane-fusion protein) [Rhodoplanes tepidamans]
MTALAAALGAGVPAPARAAEEQAGMSVSVVKAKRACFSDTVRVAGTVVAREESQVRPDIEGVRVSQILVENGDQVNSGQVLARLARIEGMNAPASSFAVQAPVAGVVGRTMTQVGAMVSMQGPPMFLIIAGGEVELQADIPSTRMGKIAVGQPARIDVTGLGAVMGRVRTVSPEINPQTQAGQARITLGDDRRIKIGTFARATVEVGTSCGMSVPLSAILFGPLGPVVQVVRDNRVETRPVPIGLLSGGNVEIRQGLAEGDLVVRRAGTFLREGDRVRAVLEETTAKN